MVSYEVLLSDGTAISMSLQVLLLLLLLFGNKLSVYKPQISQTRLWLRMPLQPSRRFYKNFMISSFIDIHSQAKFTNRISGIVFLECSVASECNPAFIHIRRKYFRNTCSR